MTEPVVFLRTVVPMVMAAVGYLALPFVGMNIKPPERGFLIRFWGGLTVL